ncbi:MAG: flagellar assembly protein FlbE [Caulobacterales bacterium]|nr:flagellar assembly protein FlbE [Caulobacterales bacterium]
MTQSPSMRGRPFAFDTEFSDTGAVLTASSFRPVKRAYAPAEVEALVAQARLEARETALAEVDSMRAMALSTIAQALDQAMPALAGVAQAHREQSAELALTAARVVAGAALDHFPLGPLKTALEALSQEIETSPRLMVQAAGLSGETRHAIEALCTDAGFSGAVLFREEPMSSSAAFRLEWADGRADYDPDAAAERMAAALFAALAAEAGHAESLPDALIDQGGAL